MGAWTDETRLQHAGLTVTVRCETARHPRRHVIAEGQGVYFSETVAWSTWEEQARGLQWMPGFLERAERAAQRQRAVGALSVAQLDHLLRLLREDDPTSSTELTTMAAQLGFACTGPDLTCLRGLVFNTSLARTHSVLPPEDPALALAPRLVEVARQQGYSLLRHGDGLRDIGFVAVPWVPDAASPHELAAALMRACGGPVDEQPSAEMAHGRLVWRLHLGRGVYCDLSVPGSARAESAAAAQLRAALQSALDTARREKQPYRSWMADAGRALGLPDHEVPCCELWPQS